MASVTTGMASRRMLKEYGYGRIQKCGTCCNCQHTAALNTSKKACIAYSESMAWDETSPSCGLYNIAFRGIRPKRRPLSEMFESRKGKSTKPSDDQESLF